LKRIESSRGRGSVESFETVSISEKRLKEESALIGELSLCTLTKTTDVGETCMVIVDVGRRGNTDKRRVKWMLVLLLSFPFSFSITVTVLIKWPFFVWSLPLLVGDDTRAHLHKSFELVRLLEGIRWLVSWFSSHMIADSLIDNISGSVRESKRLLVAWKKIKCGLILIISHLQRGTWETDERWGQERVRWGERWRSQERETQRHRERQRETETERQRERQREEKWSGVKREERQRKAGCVWRGEGGGVLTIRKFSSTSAYFLHLSGSYFVKGCDIILNILNFSNKTSIITLTTLTFR
jgi:hypothetical protein